MLLFTFKNASPNPAAHSNADKFMRSFAQKSFSFAGEKGSHLAYDAVVFYIFPGNLAGQSEVYRSVTKTFSFSFYSEQDLIKWRYLSGENNRE